MCVHIAGFDLLHFGPQLSSILIFPLFKAPLIYPIKALKIFTSHFILKTSEKLSFGSPSGKFRILHLGSFDRFDLKLICFNPKSLKVVLYIEIWSSKYFVSISNVSYVDSVFQPD